MKVLVTGGAGFLGSHIVQALLERGDEVAVFDHRLAGKCLSDQTLKAVRPFEGDILDGEAVSSASKGCDAIIHCAAVVGVQAYSEHPVKIMEVEEVGLHNVCRAALAGGRPTIIYASSSAVYGSAGGETALQETADVTPTSNYGTAKRANELYLSSQYAKHGLASVSMRIFNMYGPRQDERLVIPRFVRSAMLGADLEIYGDGTQSRDFVYVSDVVAAALAGTAFTSCCEVINVCSGQSETILHLAQTIVRLTGSKSEIVFRQPPLQRELFEVQRSVGSRARLQQLVGNHDPVPLNLGLERTIAWMRQSPMLGRGA